MRHNGDITAMWHTSHARQQRYNTGATAMQHNCHATQQPWHDATARATATATATGDCVEAASLYSSSDRGLSWQPYTRNTGCLDDCAVFYNPLRNVWTWSFRENTRKCASQTKHQPTGPCRASSLCITAHASPWRGVTVLLSVCYPCMLHRVSHHAAAAVNVCVHVPGPELEGEDAWHGAIDAPWLTDYLNYNNPCIQPHPHGIAHAHALV